MRPGEIVSMQDVISQELDRQPHLTVDGVYEETIRLRRCVRLLAEEIDRLRTTAAGHELFKDSLR